MRILCRSGHFAFYPSGSSDISRWSSMYKVNMVREEDYYTFSFLAGLQDWSLPLAPIKNLPGKVVYEGKPWEVLRENGYVYSLTLKILVPKEAIVATMTIPATGYYFTAPTPIIQPGVLNSIGQRILSYDGEFDFGIQKLRVREFSYV